MKKLILIIFSFSFAIGQLDNITTITKTGTTAAQFLKIGVDPRGSSMGNAFTAMSVYKFNVLEPCWTCINR